MTKVEYDNIMQELAILGEMIERLEDKITDLEKGKGE